MYFFPDTEGVEGQSPHLFSLSRHKAGIDEEKGKWDKNTNFSQMNFVKETFLSLGSQSGEDLGRNESRDGPFFPFPAFKLRQASQI